MLLFDCPAPCRHLYVAFYTLHSHRNFGRPTGCRTCMLLCTDCSSFSAANWVAVLPCLIWAVYPCTYLALTHSTVLDWYWWCETAGNTWLCRFAAATSFACPVQHCCADAVVCKCILPQLLLLSCVPWQWQTVDKHGAAATVQKRFIYRSTSCSLLVQA